MVDYGGIMPQLQHHLSSLLQLAQKVNPLLLHSILIFLLFVFICYSLSHVQFYFQESLIFEHIRLMVIQDMIYLIHLTELTHFLNSTFNSNQPLLFVDLHSENPKVLLLPPISTIFHAFSFVNNFYVSSDGNEN